MSKSDQQTLSRREALAKLATLSAYTAPTVTALLISSTSYAQGSCLPGVNNLAGDNGNTDKNTTMDKAAAGDKGIGSNKVTDCGRTG